MDLLDDLARAVLTANTEEVVRLSQAAIDDGIPADTAITDGLAAGMKLVGEKFARKEYFVPEVLVAGRALNAGMDVLSPHVVKSDGSGGTMVLAVVRGDFHDIGKNIVRLMLDASGLKVVDLGKNVPAERIIEAVHEHDADLVGLSTLMTTTMDSMAGIVTEVRAETNAAVLVGGAPVSSAFAEKIGADGTAPDAASAVELAHRVRKRSGK